MSREQLLAEESSIAFRFSKKVWSQQPLSQDYDKVNYADSSGRPHGHCIGDQTLDLDVGSQPSKDTVPAAIQCRQFLPQRKF